MGDAQNLVAIPGAAEISDYKLIPTGLIIVAGHAGVGKTLYCRQFLTDRHMDGDFCLCISSNERQQAKSPDYLLITPTATAKEDAQNLESCLDPVRTAVSQDKRVALVIDSLTQLYLLYGEQQVLKLLSKLSVILKESGSTAVCTITQHHRQELYGLASTFVDALIEMELIEEGDTQKRRIRLLSLRGLYHEPRWTEFKLDRDGQIHFESPRSESPAHCALCGKIVSGKVLAYSSFEFDSKKCLETYRKLASAYGRSITEAGLPSDAFNANFFFIDIVGLSDPNLSVKRQVRKIEELNVLLASCGPIRKTQKSERIILPTGDGMAIGFLLKSELPLELAIELHRKLAALNKNRSEGEQLDVRIGLGSGPVFAVTDMNGVQNVWGPGIILARRVMDVGGPRHILIEGKYAEELIQLNDEYRSYIKPIYSAYEIKHGRRVTLYSAFSGDFGNPSFPSKISSTKP